MIINIFQLTRDDILASRAIAYSSWQKENTEAVQKLAFVRWLVESLHKWPVTWIVCPCHDVIMT